MFFLNPTYLWALLGLLVPIAIHLWSKKEGKTIKIGSIKLLDESDSKQTSSIQINELWLLVLRLVLLSVLIIIIAGPQIKKKVSTIPITYIFESSLLQYEEIYTILDTIEEGESLRMLQTDFPELQKDQLDSVDIKVPNYWQLAKEMETLETDSIVVFTNGFRSGIKGIRPKVNKDVNWVILDLEKPFDQPIGAVKKESKIQLLSVSSDHDGLSFNKQLLSSNSDSITLNTSKDSLIFSLEKKKNSIPLINEKTITILLFYEDSLSNEMKYCNAAFRAISKYINRPVELQIEKKKDTIDFDTFDLMVWLSKNPIPKTSAKVLAYRPDELAHNIIEEGPSSRTFYLTSPLNTENSINKHLSEELLYLIDIHKEAKEKIDLYDKRVMDIKELSPLVSNLKIDKKNASIFDISQWLWIVLVFLLIIERIIAKYRRQ
ncbi:BatA domain-containing protein [Aquimarina algiphila]|uniref:Aerotolerance regulator N-terminal domain-containing protein n=1 Tax=Aquimarina algiphila TaxID=2047982 RepID=A0A554VI22_9FLAO|nr:BatA domain-containing protein [Aquimarina algiphila]TSE07276.1 hypothetical protein FOF46_16480 [Aquimarina algiphila]